MNHDLFAARVAAALSADHIQRHAPLAPLTTFNVGGPADWLVDVRTVDELTAVLAAARDAGLPVTLLGGGSNVLVSDDGVRGVVVRVQFRDIAQTAPDRVRAGGGVTINGLVRWTISHGLAGIEAWAGTPGTVGGAIYGNAHFQGRDISALLAAVHVCALDGRTVTVPISEMGFSYDTSRLSTTHEVVVWAELVVSHGDTDALRATARESLAYRKRTQPLAMPSAGCIFQNPDAIRDPLPHDVPASAGALIDRAGRKGHRIGGAAISAHHANFIVNDAGARAADVRALIEEARRAVRDRFGIDLRLEVVLLGDWPGT